MTAIIIIGLVIFFIYSISGKKKISQQKTTYTNSNKRQKPEKGKKEKFVQNLLKDIKVTATASNNLNTKNNIASIITFTKESENKNSQKIKIKVDTTNSNKSNRDESIFDITGEVYNLREEPLNLQKPGRVVPVWKNQPIYSCLEINSATIEQKEFYHYFKHSFINGQYFDIGGNTNYAFILLFDLINDYENHRNLLQTRKQLEDLGQFYPKTKFYALPHFKSKLWAIGDLEAIDQFKKEDSPFNDLQAIATPNYSFDGNYWGIGTKHKAKLNLNKEEVQLLNKLFYSDNNFCSVKFCFLEILKLYIATINGLKEKYHQEGTTLDAQFLAVADIVARKQFRYQNGSQNYRYCIETTTSEIYTHIFKHCENAVRECYSHKRKINTDIAYTNAEAKAQFEAKIISKVTELLPTLISKVTPPNEATEIELYSQNTNRWKIKFEELTTNYKDNAKQFIDSIISLGNLNKKNPSIENIFFEASKFISKSNKEAALTLYVHYLYHDLKSATFDNKQLTKTIQKSLFKTNEQLHDFEIVVGELIKDKNLENALQGVSKIYTVKRKKIQLDTASIKEVQQQDSGTVELLNEYLKDDYEDENNSIKTQEINSEEVSIQITQKTEVIENSIYVSTITFTQLQTTTLEIFTKSNFSVPQSDLEIFAKSKGVFKNQLVENINETCYDVLDDILIEEEEEYYNINPNYYQRLLAK